MDIQTIKRRARANILFGVGLAVFDVGLAVAEAANGSFILLGITAACFVVIVACLIMNVRIAVQ